MSSPFRILFLGTPEFAVPSLEILLEGGYKIIGVITAPDKPAGRGLQLHESAVKKFATQNNLKVLQPEKLKDENFLNELKSLQPDLAVVVAFRKLTETVWNLPRLGTFNLHASLLPNYRGAAPINWAVINGEKETGVTTFFITHEIDTGKIILQEKVLIGQEETAGELHDELKTVGGSLVLKTVQQIESGNVSVIEQPMTNHFKKAPKLFTADCKIDWTKNAQEIFNLIRGLSPYPAAFTGLNGKVFKIFRAKKISEAHHQTPGKIYSDGKTFLRFACDDGWIEATEVQLEGKKKMTAEEFLRGHRI
ncbi:MAG TPA: methionyl-tRNA formyltransferase [Chitinophagales bacterium]|nr:methionyl-tRNA formyltransferase [Chitinophagales bacterium]